MPAPARRESALSAPCVEPETARVTRRRFPRKARTPASAPIFRKCPHPVLVARWVEYGPGSHKRHVAVADIARAERMWEEQTPTDKTTPTADCRNDAWALRNTRSDARSHRASPGCLPGV